MEWSGGVPKFDSSAVLQEKGSGRKEGMKEGRKEGRKEEGGRRNERTDGRAGCLRAGFVGIRDGQDQL